MRLALAAVALLLCAAPACGGGKVNPQHSPGPTTSGAAMSTTTPPPAEPGKFSVSSTAFADNTQIPVEYSCRGRNVPPPLRWENVPPGTESLALVVDDPDAPAGLYVHWVVTGIPPSTTGIGDGPLPQGASVSLNSAGKAEYFGPCPPAGTGVHHYRFQLYALNQPLTLASSTPAREATETIAKAATAEARIVGLFGG
ncbi:YbhB/YbcL family Raf kinase inhibitor-like protein [Mycobacterium xenopi]|nr:YbhB/YbcL family Raf kinase inhibitor-like protein [Mycobacterium xenopi]MDA3638815.1 YbhB/YbcL family Raf kinase inhibitor-like protein [Mycobacterium xenopi]MDA3657079.1 YbhB/YbcL family Raf kinase inhibitor-like protein [Mycobacterium xenopi]MDA3662226.1 YbhB/YbcL family Raf kinase inhibitor-like protein [Mycobacterium xenopi]